MNPADTPPGATYRLQFNPGFRFVDGRDLVPYLSELGITDLYSSPRYKPRRGSHHGYDIANPLRINSELGTEEDFDEMAEKLRHYGMGLLLDTVPNHMAASYENPWWTDVLENGQSSAYANYFDIDWHPLTTKATFLQDRRVLLPMLGELYGDVLANGQFTLKIEDTGIHVRYYDTRLPLDPKTYDMILEHCPTLPEIVELLGELKQLPDRDDLAPERVQERRRGAGRVKGRLWSAYQSNPEVKHAVDESLLFFTGSIDDLDAVLSRQAYRMAYWKIGYEEINYRRFFDVNELVGLRIENAEVFDNRNQKILELMRSGKITGLRIDHIDGLWDPECYLRKLLGRVPGKRFYIVVEKILGRDEPLPKEWPVAGTTGYEFRNAVNGIFVHPDGLARLEEIYARRTGSDQPFAETCYQSSKLVIENLFKGDVNALVRHLGALAAHHRQARDVRLSELTEALVEVIACLPVYRTYIHDFEIAERDRGYIERTLELARRRTSAEVGDAAFDFIRSVLLLEPPYYLKDRKKEWLTFVMRWQQFTGPVMAKGLEDTASYRHNSLLSLNEVGGDSLRDQPPFDLDEFHEFNRRRLEEWPDTLNATATHDTKRGEDVHARLNVLTEVPDEWERRLDRWMEWNAPLKELVDDVPAPSPGEEILIYQTIAGAWPGSEEGQAAFPVRLQEYLVKALREAKQNSSWIAPRENYENAVVAFVGRILSPESQFVNDLRDFHLLLAAHGSLNSLAQLLLKIASPGVPDFYQGTECWQLSLVDPDNRRPVDFRKRAEVLESLRRRESEDRLSLIQQLAADPTQDEIKLFLTYKGLQFRKTNRELFARGEYLPVRVQGSRERYVCAFARRLGERWAVVAAPRWTSQIGEWGDTELILPEGAPAEWQDALTGIIPSSRRLADVLASFPVALWSPLL